MARRNPLKWTIPVGLSFDLAALRARSEDDFNPGTLKGHIELLMLRALKTVLARMDETAVPPEEFGRLVEAEFQSLLATHRPAVTQSVGETVEVLSEESWKALKEKRLRDGIEHHRREYDNGRFLGLGILGPKLVPSGEPPVTLQAVTLSFDQTLLHRQKMLSLAQDILTEDFLLNERPNPILTQILSDAISGEPLYDFSVAELFELYGELVNHLPENDKKKELNKWINDKGFKNKVSGALLGNSFTTQYYFYSKNGYSTTSKPVPLPFAIRNTLAHREASNPNVARLKHVPHGVHDSVVILRAIKSEYFSGS